MNFLALEYFLEIERAGSFSAAARKLFVSQQSLSESIQKLEQEVGTTLFVRKRPLVLTEAGFRFSQGPAPFWRSAPASRTGTFISRPAPMSPPTMCACIW